MRSLPTFTTASPPFRPDDAYDLWLYLKFHKPDDICGLLKPFDPAVMRRLEVSNRVNPVKNNDPACAEPVSRLNIANALGRREPMTEQAKAAAAIFRACLRGKM